MAHLSGATRFAVLDAFKGYMQFPVDPDCQEYLSLMTHDGSLHPIGLSKKVQKQLAIFRPGCRKLWR